MTTRVFGGIKLCEQFLKKTSQGTFLLSLVQIGQEVWEEMFKKLLTTHDGRRTADTGPPQKLSLSTLCSGELKKSGLHVKFPFLADLYTCKSQYLKYVSFPTRDFISIKKKKLVLVNITTPLNICMTLCCLNM